jgi:glycosyltransferase involved in cell wall biosynthesis
MEKSSLSPVRISVVIPTYNRATELDRCLDSLVQQTYKNFEVLVCDDGSTDLSKNVVDGYKDRLDLTYIYCDNFGGPARPRNLGVNAAKSPYIAFLDSDDWWSPEKLSICASRLVKDDVDLLYHDMLISSSSIKRYRYMKAFEPRKGMFNALLTTGVSIPNSSVIVRRHLLLEVGGISEDRILISVEDYDTWVKVAQLTDRFVRIPRPLGFYELGIANISAASTRQVEKINYLYAQYASKLTKGNLKKSDDFLLYRNAYIFQGSGELGLAKEYFHKAIFSSVSFKYRMKSIYRYLSIFFLHR